MAEYIKFRLTAAKLGVSMALMALIAGIAERVGATSPRVQMTESASLLSNAAIQGGSLGKKVLKLDNTLLKLEQKLSKVYFTYQKLDTTFLKIDQANQQFLKIRPAETEFLKIDTANLQYLKIDAAATQFLKITDANSQFLKLTDANSQFLKITDANTEFLKASDAANQYLKLDGTASNAIKLGNLTPDMFVQGRGGTAAASTHIPFDLTQAQVIQSPDKTLTVSVASNSDQVVVDINNSSGALLPAVRTADGSVSQMDLGIGDNKFTFANGAVAHQFQLQTFGDGSVRTAVTLVLSTEPVKAAVGGPATTTNVVAQMLIGLL